MAKGNATVTARTVLMWVWLFVSILMCFTFLPLGVILLIVDICAFLFYGSVERTKRYMKKYDIPAKSKPVTYYQGFDTGINKSLYYWITNNSISFAEAKTEYEEPVKFEIPKESIVSFTSTGEVTTSTSVSGGGVSLGGAAVGGVLLGPVGAILGGRKKVSSSTKTIDTRRTILRYVCDDGEISVMFGGQIFNDLCMLCVEKKV